MIDYKQKLLKFDGCYFFEEDYDYCINAEDASYYLATYLYDNNFEVNKESWIILKDIKTDFPELYDMVIYNIFNRNHDT